jgi:short-subunit dehydrogenase
MTQTALITGASSGIGSEFARYHASKGGNVILTARREPALNALKAELEEKYAITAYVFALDLGKEGGAKALYEQVTAAGLQVDILVNNAGFGGQGDFITRDLEADLAMIDLNVKALVALTHLAATDMVARGSGKILHVGSTAGFMPGPLQATYFATKAFVNSFRQALDEELRAKGVTSTVLAPGYVETEFAKSADLEGTGLVSGGGASAADVAKHGYDAMMAAKLVTINEFALRFMINWIMPLMPLRMKLKMVRKMQTKSA